MKLCPICETENKPQATHCEVCGERLAPPAPGQTLAPEESVMAQIKATPPPPAPSPTQATPASPAAAGAFVKEEAAPPAQAPPPKKAISDADLEAAFAALKGRVDSGDVPEDVLTGTLSDLPPLAPPASATPSAPASSATPAPAQVDRRPPPPTPPPALPTPPPAAPVRREPEPPPRIISSGMPDARLVVYQNKQPAHTHPIVNDETLIGRYDPLSGSYPDLDVTEFDKDGRTSRKHVYIYRNNRDYFLYPISNGGTQLGQEIVEMGQRKQLKDGDVIILAASLAMKFHIDG